MQVAFSPCRFSSLGQSAIVNCWREVRVASPLQSNVSRLNNPLSSRFIREAGSEEPSIGKDLTLSHAPPIMRCVRPCGCNSFDVTKLNSFTQFVILSDLRLGSRSLIGNKSSFGQCFMVRFCSFGREQFMPATTIPSLAKNTKLQQSSMVRLLRF
ncbi:hypothetical protein AAHE18_04G057100 [Arachis hypogaea]